jgi:hypothetical protein
MKHNVSENTRYTLLLLSLLFFALSDTLITSLFSDSILMLLSILLAFYLQSCLIPFLTEMLKSMKHSRKHIFTKKNPLDFFPLKSCFVFTSKLFCILEAVLY